MKRKRRGALLGLPMTLWTAVFVGIVLLYLLALSFFTPTGEGYGVRPGFTLENYRRLLSPAYLQVLGKSLLLAFYTTLICLGLGYPFGYCMARAGRKWRGILMLLVIVPFWTNALVRIYGWKILLMGNGPVNDLLMALHLTDKPLKLLNTYGAVLLGMVYALIPFMILPVYSSVEKMDWSLVAAARDMGAGPMRAFVTVTLPLTAPGAMAGVVLTFVPAIGLFFISDLLGGATDMYVGNLVRDQMLKAKELPFAAAVSVVLLILTLLILRLYRRFGGDSGDMTLF
ncbi:MAG: ABC transporter permease [Eubacteriales bacterium]|nr:ABC transporter permease [Eubacteriales bacterium]